MTGAGHVLGTNRGVAMVRTCVGSFGEWTRLARLLAMALGAWLLMAPLAHAQGADDEEAHRRFEAGSLAFQAGRYDDAMDDFQRAYRLSHRPELLYNVGQCADRLRHDAEALEAFEGYLREAGDDASHRTEVEARVAVLRTVVARGTTDADTADEHTSDADTTTTTTPSPTGDPTLSPAPVASDGGPDVGGIAITAASGAVLVAGAVLLGIAETDRASVENAAPETHWSSIADAASRGPVLEGVGIGALVAGAIGLTAGLILLTTHDTHEGSVRVGVGPMMVSLSGTLP